MQPFTVSRLGVSKRFIILLLNKKMDIKTIMMVERKKQNYSGTR